MSDIKISVLMSVYNAEDYLAQALESILTQTYKNIEFIIVNDGSSDSSLELINTYSAKDNRIVVVDQKNMGLTKALNVGIKIATGDYIARMDADDVSLPNRFENFLRFIDKNGDIDLYSTPAYIINETNEVQKVIPNFFRRNGFQQQLLNYYNSMIHGTLIAKATVLKKFQYNESFQYSQDFELYHRLMRKNYHISYDNNNISYQLRIHSNSITNTQKPKQLELFKSIFDENKIRFYKQSLVNRVYFKLIDFFYYLLSIPYKIVSKSPHLTKNK